MILLFLIMYNKKTQKFKYKRKKLIRKYSNNKFIKLNTFHFYTCNAGRFSLPSSSSLVVEYPVPPCEVLLRKNKIPQKIKKENSNVIKLFKFFKDILIFKKNYVTQTLCNIIISFSVNLAFVIG